MSELLAAARPSRRASRAAATSPARGAAASFATLETAGRPPKSGIIEGEKRLVREHFDAINERLAAEGLRPIDLDDPAHIERYDLGDLAAKRGAAVGQPVAATGRASAAASAAA